MPSRLHPTRLLQIIREKREGLRDRTVVVFWHQVVADREQYARELRIAARGSPIVPLVLRKGFENDNSVMTDLCRLIEENQASFGAPHFPALPAEPPVTLVLLSRKPLSLGQCSSSGVLPRWFPVCGGEEIRVQIEDLFWTGMAPLDAEEVRAGELCARLYELDLEMIRRWRRGRAAEPTRGDAFFSCIQDQPNPSKPRSAPPPSCDDFLQAAERRLSSRIHNPEAFRPSADPNTPSLVGRLFRLAGRTSRDQLLTPAQHLARALGLPSDCEPPPDSFMTVLNRTSSPVSDPTTHFAWNVIITVYAALKLVNVGAHSDRVPKFPIALLQSFSSDLHLTLEKLRRCLQEWPDLPSP